MKKTIENRLARDRAKASAVGSGDSEGGALVGFGNYGTMTRAALFHSVAEEHRNYVKEILCHPVTHPGGQLDQLKKYLLRMQEKVTADDQALAQALEEMEQTATGRCYIIDNL